MWVDCYPSQDTNEGETMSQCDRCEVIIPDEDVTTVIHQSSEEILGELCSECVSAWFKFVEDGGEE